MRKMISQENPPINKPKMAYSCNLSKMAIMDYQGTLGNCSGQPPPLFSRKSDSRIANVHLSVHHKNPSASQNQAYLPLCLSIDLSDTYQPSCQSAFMHANQLSCQSIYTLVLVESLSRLKK